ncbi:MAG: bifunctional DNA primase/polymerase, partial [Pseudomonadota bacterium]
MTLAASAQWLAEEMGLPVFPCDEHKRPMTPNGFKDATLDPETIRRSFARAAMIGIPTGEASGFFVLDLDCKNGAQGLE